MSSSDEKKLPAISNTIRAAWNIARAVGPFLISQSDTASEAYARHKKRLAEVEVWKGAMNS